MYKTAQITLLTKFILALGGIFQSVVTQNQPDPVPLKWLDGRSSGDGSYTRPDRLTAYAYMKTGNSAYAERAIQELTSRASTAPLETEEINGPDVPNPIIEAWRVNTNQAAHWSLYAIEILEMASDQIPRRAPESEE